jgi:predicted Fe-Mo cluster-binding NifX family protein
VKIAISATKPGLDAEVDPRFGRCAFFLLVDSDSGQLLQAEKNAFAAASGGAGTQAAQRIAEWGAEAVLTGNIGPNAFQILDAAKIPTFPGVSGSVKDAIASYLAGELKPVSSPTARAHQGMR